MDVDGMHKRRTGANGKGKWAKTKKAVESDGREAVLPEAGRNERGRELHLNPDEMITNGSDWILRHGPCNNIVLHTFGNRREIIIDDVICVYVLCLGRWGGWHFICASRTGCRAHVGDNWRAEFAQEFSMAHQVVEWSETQLLLITSNMRSSVGEWMANGGNVAIEFMAKLKFW